MASGQQFLFAPDKPLVKRLGKQFFRRAPRSAGVYKMRDAADAIVYVGKAKNLRQRLSHYRVANPERLGRRHLRLLQEVTRIEMDLCPSESAALAHEAKLIRQLRPKFNRAGTWQGRAQFLTWRLVTSAIEFSVHEIPPAGWERVGSLGAYAGRLKVILVQLLWLAVNPGSGFQGMPYGWPQGRMPDLVRLECGSWTEEVRAALNQAFWGEPKLFLNWCALRFAQDRPAFERNALGAAMMELQQFFERKTAAGGRTGQLALL